MRVLAITALIFLVRPGRGCVAFGAKDKVSGLLPYQQSYNENDVTNMTCSTNYVIPWATNLSNTSGVIKCGSDSWYPEQAVAGFTGTIAGCVACITGVINCTSGNCTDGLCVCKDNFELSDTDPRLCEEITCAKPDLSNQEITLQDDGDVNGPFAVGTVITVTCTDKFHVKDDTDMVAQVAECGSDGFFNETIVECVVCATNKECTNGVCNANKICECDENNHFKLNETDPSTCLKVTCENNNPCENNGECSVDKVALECKCQVGTQGPTCSDFTKTLEEVCAGDPCNPDNGGTCSRVSGEDVTDFNQYVCNCTDDKFSGSKCQYANNFFVGNEGFKKTGVKSESVEFDMVAAKGMTPMYIALFKVIDQDDAEYKVLLLNPDDSKLQLHVVKIDGMPEDPVEISDGFAFGGSPLNVKVHRDSGNSRLTLTVGGTSKSSIIVKEITDFVIGGVGCAWNDENCLFGKSRIFYHSFVGYFGDVSVGGLRQTFANVKASTPATANILTCGDYTCPNSGTCDDTSGQIVCSCRDGFEGTDCLTYKSGMSFNGYTSDFHFAPTIVPVLADEQTVVLQFVKLSEETGELAEITVFGCVLAIKAIEGGKITLKFKSGTVEFDGRPVADCAVNTTSLSASASASLGGKDPDSESSITLQDSRFKGCISKITVNNMDIMKFSDSNTNNNVDISKCTTDYSAPNPCDADVNPCKNDMGCEVLLDDNTANCDCKAPYDLDDNCTRKMYCEEDNTCTTDHSTCNELMNITECNTAKSTKEELVCEEDKVWYYWCKCSDGWTGLNCDVEVDEEPEPVVDEGNDTTTIIIVVVVVAVVLGVVVTVIIVKKRKSSSGNGAPNGKNGESYSPQAQEKDLEMSGKIDDNPKRNIYEDVDVIKNPNAESPELDTPEPAAGPAEETADTVDPKVQQPTETADIMVEPSAPI
ncbi:hypothetical protein ACHWQZ_G016954 [Mnemiopsis leidyi]